MIKTVQHKHMTIMTIMASSSHVPQFSDRGDDDDEEEEALCDGIQKNEE
jgi:hypothetical protein